jgi:putative membrane-bound dehydrogenase-like protein
MLPRFLFLSLACASIFAAEPEVDPKEMPRFPAVEPAEAAKTFVIREGFKVELAASEPNVVSPVALSFDEDGRMYVVEMRDYSEHRDDKLGRIRLLEDTDGDGMFDKSTIFAEGLAWPTAVICYDGGIFVGATPDILFLKDTNGDGKADERRVVFTGFGKGVERLNVQQLLNSFHWGLDNRIHGANGGNGATLEQVASGGPTIRLGTRDFSFDPRTLTMRPETGGGQHGMSFDDFGRKFVSNNSSHIRMQVYEDRYLQGVTGISLPPGIVDIAREGPAAEVFRISPEEPWRTIRTRWRVAGQVPGPIEGGGRASGYFTGATGVTIFRGDAYPPAFRGNAFIGDAGGNLVHRKILEPDGVIFEAHRAPDELNREFLASRDTWFRPVQFANAPDGCLYVIDMYREVIEHPWSIPPNLKKLVDLDSGRERGRIWRIVPENFKRRPAPKLSKASGEELVKTLDHPNGWNRDTAARLLFQRDDRALAPRIAEILKSPRPASRAQALSVLSSWGELADHITEAIQGSNDVLERALIAMETPGIGQRRMLSNLPARSRNARIRHQLAWTVSVVQPPNTIDLLAEIIATDPRDPYISAAVLVAARTNAPALFEKLIQNSYFLGSRDGASEFLAKLAVNASPQMLEESLDRAAHVPDQHGMFELAAAVAETMDKRKINRPAKLNELFALAARNLATSAPAIQIAAIHLLQLDPSESTTEIFTRTFLEAKSDPVRIEAFRALNKSSAATAPLLWTNWSALPTQVRQAAIDIILARKEGATLLIDALQKSQISRADLTASQIQTLRQHSNPAISRPALELLGKVDADRASVIERFRPALNEHGDMKAGEKLFTERCATCHRFAGKGAAVGPDLESVRGNGREYLLTHLLDPNREVNTRYVMYVAELREGDTVSGILARETDTQVTLRLANAEEKTFLRSQIKRLTASAQSLMPAGLEEGLDSQAMAGLLDFLGKSP